MRNLIVVKFGSSAIGVNGKNIPMIIKQIKEFKKQHNVIAIFSAPTIIYKKKKKSLTDVILEIKKKKSIINLKNSYRYMITLVNKEYRNEIIKTINKFFDKTKKILDKNNQNKFNGEDRAKILAYTGEILISNIMTLIMKSNGINSETITFEKWPIITDDNSEYANFMFSESRKKIDHINRILEENKVVSIGGFIGKTTKNIMTTYERGGSDRTAINLGMLLYKKYKTKIYFEKDSSIVSADPKIVHNGLSEIAQLSYNEARLAGMFGMKILDPIVIKELLENRIDISLIIINMNDPTKTTIIKKKISNKNTHPLKIVTGKKNCAVLRIENRYVHKLLKSLEVDKQYNEFVMLSPFIKNGVLFARILFLDADYIRKNKIYFLSFDSFTNITYNRGVITLIGDELWRIHHVVTKISYRIGKSGLNILNIDAQEETSRIIIVIDDADQNVEKAVRAIHAERAIIKFSK